MTNSDFFKTHPLTDTLADGTEVHLVLPIERTGNRPLYTSSQGKPYSHVRVLNKQTGTHEWIYREQVPIMDTTPVNRFNGHRKQRYHKMSHFGNIYLSHAVALAWIGPQPEGYVVDHLNGVTTDNRAENLEAITPQENARRVPYLHALRKLIPNHWQTFGREDYLRFYGMPLAEFQGMLAHYVRRPADA